MKLDKLKINSYGKLREKEMEFGKNINIIYGKNESGKSTMLSFILSMLYGVSKNKKGKEISNYEKYKPWNSDEFSGKIIYTLDDNEKYQVFRDFNKKNVKIFNEKMDDISNEFNIDKVRGNEFFYEQTNITEELFLATLVSQQQEVKLEKNEQTVLIQKITNLVGTGEDNISFKKSIDKLNKKQLEEIGSDRTREKPINILERNIEKLELERRNAEKSELLKDDIEDSKTNLNKKVNEIDKAITLLKELKEIQQKEDIEKEKIDVKEELNNQQILEIKEIEEEIEKSIQTDLKLEEKYKKDIIKKQGESKKKIKINIWLSIAIILLNIIQSICISNSFVNIFILIGTVIFLIIFNLLMNLKSKNLAREIKNEYSLNKKNNEYKRELLEIDYNKYSQNYKNNIENVLQLREKIKKEFQFEKNRVLSKCYSNEYLILPEKLNNIDKIIYEIEDLENKINKYKVELHKSQLDKENIDKNCKDLATIEEELNLNINNRDELIYLSECMEICKETLSDAYDEMKYSITPKFTRNLSRIISEITKNKYTNVQYNEENGLMVELENGNYELISRLSIGTIEQLYLALRLSMIEELYEEKMPIILDESFAFYDKERLENILKYFAEHFKDNQILIFTCINREKELLDKNNIEYNLIEL